MLLRNLLEKTKAFRTVGSFDADSIDITGICPESSRVKPGDIFFAIEGLHTDGHKFISDAVKRGAEAVAVTESAVNEGRVNVDRIDVPVIIFEDTRKAIASAYSAWYGEPQKKLKIIGVTGTNGKTSVSRLIYEILNSADKPCGLIGTTGSRSHKREINIRANDPNANMTTPDPEELYAILSEMVGDGCEYAVMEVTSHALALRKVEPITFEISVFTNLSEDHLDLHGDMESYFRAKASLFEKSRRAVINYDDYYGRLLADKIKIPISTCSSEGRLASFVAEDLHLLGERGIEYKLTSRDLRLRVRSPLVGGFNIMNTMQAAVTSHIMGADAASIKDTLAHFGGISGRLERVKLGSKLDFSVFIDYAHTPDALANLLRAARSFARHGERIVLLFGCGGDREKQKRPLMGKIAASMADYVVITSDNSRSEEPRAIIDDILSGIDKYCSGTYTVIDDRRAAIEYVIKNARRGDIILLAGKGHEEYEIDRMGKRAFSEKEIVIEFVGKYF
jgi:UDP-N-acetylmuramoyl-L-alanyl-D-glutamate--2,6-diaminopimelate ligase